MVILLVLVICIGCRFLFIIFFVWGGGVGVGYLHSKRYPVDLGISASTSK